MINANVIITESLSPAVAISAIGLLIFGLNNRITTIGTRIRDLNKELRQSAVPDRRDNITRQTELFLKRAYLIRNSMFMLFTALGLMVFTAVSLAMARLYFSDWQIVPTISFISGLLLTFLAVTVEAYEVIVNLKTLRLDIEGSKPGQE